MSNKTMDHQTEEKTGSQQRTVLKQALAAALAAGIEVIAYDNKYWRGSDYGSRTCRC
jgi:hypothetical protein